MQITCLASRAAVATGAWVKSKHDIFLRRGSVGAYNGANGNGILIFLKVVSLRRSNNFNLEFDRACVRSFYDGTTFTKF